MGIYIASSYSHCKQCFNENPWTYVCGFVLVFLYNESGIVSWGEFMFYILIDTAKLSSQKAVPI